MTPRKHYRMLCLVVLVIPESQAWVLNRRACLDMLSWIPMTALTTITSNQASVASAIDRNADITTTTRPRMPSMPDNVVITDKVFMDVRVARKDGSTYVRDDLDDSFENTVLIQRIKFGLYGKLAPNHVEKFLSYIETPKNVDEEELLDNPYPSYSRSTFQALDQTTGLLIGGNIPSLRVKDVAGTTALTYGSRVLPANLWIDQSSPESRVSHSTKGLLTHRNLDVLPTFGITTRSQPSLDSTNTVFGQVLWDEDTLRFFRDLENIPTYSVERAAGFEDFNGEVATTVFNAQREFFRGAAKTFGDDRVSKLYDGKLLRRMEVMQVGRF